MKHFFTADTHFGHSNIIEFCKRPFANVNEMDEALIAAWNKRVGHEDLVYHLGDFSMYDVAKYRARLNGRIILISGNHDYRHRGIAQHFKDVRDVTLLKLNGREIFMSHYAHRVWPKKHYNAWHLYGHSHAMLGTTFNYMNSMDIGVDTHPDFAPYSFDELVRAMDQQTFTDPLSDYQQMAALACDRLDFLVELAKDNETDAECLRLAINEAKEEKDRWVKDPKVRLTRFQEIRALYSIGGITRRSNQHVQRAAETRDIGRGSEDPA